MRYARIGRSWQKYGEARSLQLVLQHLWGWWLFDRGLGEAACPINSIFGDAWGVAESASTSSSRASGSAPSAMS